MMQSRFKAWVSILLSACFITSLVGFICCIVTLNKDAPLLRVGGHPASSLSHILSLFWSLVLTILFFAVLRKKAVRVTFIGQEMIVQNFLGLGGQKCYLHSELMSFTTSTQYSRAGSYEVLDLLLQDGKTIELSEFYHKNYNELKAYLETTGLPNLGYKPSNSFRVFMSLFT